MNGKPQQKDRRRGWGSSTGVLVGLREPHDDRAREAVGRRWLLPDVRDARRGNLLRLERDVALGAFLATIPRRTPLPRARTVYPLTACPDPACILSLSRGDAAAR